MGQKEWDVLIKNLVKSNILRSPIVIRSLRKVTRESFLPEKLKNKAAMDCPLPIGSGQTASAPLSHHGVVDWAKHGIHYGRST